MKKQLFYLTFSTFFIASTNISNAAKLNLQINDINTSSSPAKTAKGNNGDNGIKGKIMVSGAVGFNATRTLLLAKYIAADDIAGNITPVISSTSQVPLINLGVDYGLASKFSAGVAFGYQSIKLNADAANNGIAGTDTWTRIHMAVRGDYYIVTNDNINLYTGLKIGYNIYNVKSTYSSLNPNYISNLKSEVGTPLTTGVQAHFGFSYYFNGMIGFNTEAGLAVGGPYYFAVGVGFKF